jgi:hypothetical protein
MVNQEIAFIYKSYKASSLVEATIAMVITGIVFSAALMIMLNISSGSDNLQKLKYSLVLRQMADETVKNKAFSSGHIFDGPITIEKEIMTYPGNSDLKILSFTAWRDKTILASHKIMLYEPED